MDLKQLEIFIKIVELKSFSKAADAVYLSQPTVSSHIQNLENELGFRLFDRLGRDITPTRAGLLLYDYAREMLALRDKAGQALNQFMGKIKGELLVGGSNIPGEYLLPSIIGNFRSTYPEVTVVLKIGDTADIVERLLDGGCEIGMVGSKMEDDRIEYHDFIRDELVLIASHSYQVKRKGGISAEDLGTIPFIIRERGSGSRATIEKALTEMGLNHKSMNIVAEMGSTEAIKHGVKAGLGTSIVSSLAVADDVRHKTLKILPIQGKKFLRRFYIAHHKGRTLSPVASSFLEFLKRMKN